MKNMFKSKFSLVAICIILGILIGSFALCGCTKNYSIIEGLETEDKDVVKDATKDIGEVSDPTEVANNATKQMISISDISDSIKGLGDSLGTNGNAITNTIAKALQTVNPVENVLPAAPDTENAEPAPTSSSETDKKKKEGFQVSKPLSWGPIKNTESEDVNLSKWVSDALRYSKGMGNDDRLDSYQYNTGPEIPLPEGELNFFKDTKFDPSCCPGTYSNSMGCACFSKKQLQYLTTRGGNNTIPKTKTAYYNEY